MEDGIQSVTQKGWRISTRKLPILKAGPIEEMTDNLGIAPPEMIFGDNFARVEHLASGWTIDFNAFDALDRVDKTGEAMLKVSYSRDWQRSRKRHTEDIKDVVKPFDWSYTTDYRGSVSKSPVAANSPSTTVGESQSASTISDPPDSSSVALAPTTESLPLELLKRPDPILFFDDLMLYEDELGDNGTSLFSLKIRVMPQRMLLLARFFLRLDDVVFRIRDTRLFVEFETGRILREHTVREEKFEVVREALKRRSGGGTVGRGADASVAYISAAMTDPNRVVDVLPVIDSEMVGATVK